MDCRTLSTMQAFPFLSGQSTIYINMSVSELRNTQWEMCHSYRRGIENEDDALLPNCV